MMIEVFYKRKGHAVRITVNRDDEKAWLENMIKHVNDVIDKQHDPVNNLPHLHPDGFMNDEEFNRFIRKRG